MGIGAYENLERFLPLLQDPQSETMLKTAYQISNVIISTCTINTASERAGKVVFALKNYARYNATGEKLDIVKKIIDKHRGKIEVESMPGQTTFMVFLPIALADRAGI